MKYLLLLFCLLSLPTQAAPVVRKEFVEEDAKKSDAIEYKRYEALKKKMNQTFVIEGSISESFRKASERYDVPGFISAAPIPDTATIVGPNDERTGIRIGDTIYLRWSSGGAMPREGSQFSVYSPAIVLQNMEDPTDFIVRQPVPIGGKLPTNYRLAGYFYETSGTVRITKLSQGIVEALVLEVRARVDVGDKLMPLLPRISDIRPVTGGIQIAAAVVSGSPAERLSTTKRSFVYINRGAKDGIKVGRVFQAVESVPLENINVSSPDLSLGEAMVVYVSDAYSTAVITQQFDVIRIGALLKAKQEFTYIPPKTPFSALNRGNTPAPNPEQEVEVPEGRPVDLPESEATSAPSPGKVEIGKDELSELDQLERKKEISGLSPAEKLRLERLHKQESKIGNALPVSDPELPNVEAPFAEEPSNVPALPSLDLGTNTTAPPKKKDDKKDNKKKKKKVNDEEELNLLMMQN